MTAPLCRGKIPGGSPPPHKFGALLTHTMTLIVQDAHAIYMAQWEIIAREFLTVAYISMNPA